MNTPKSSRWHLRPTVENLESLQLLSGMAHAVAVHPVGLVHAEVISSPSAVGVVHLHGTIHAIGRIAGESISITGSGNLGAVGTASIDFHASLTTRPNYLTLVTKKGQINLSPTGATLPGTFTSPTSVAEKFNFDVVGGTGAYPHATGSGAVAAKFFLSSSGKITVNFRFS